MSLDLCGPPERVKLGICRDFRPSLYRGSPLPRAARRASLVKSLPCDREGWGIDAEGGSTRRAPSAGQAGKRTTSEVRWHQHSERLVSKKDRILREVLSLGQHSHTLRSCHDLKRFFGRLCQPAFHSCGKGTETNQWKGRNVYLGGSQFLKGQSKVDWLCCLGLREGPDKVGSRWWPQANYLIVARKQRDGEMDRDKNPFPKAHSPPQSHLLVPHPFNCELMDGLTHGWNQFLSSQPLLSGATGWTSSLPNTWHFICKSQHGPNLWGLSLLPLIMNASYVSILWNGFCISWVHHFPWQIIWWH